MLKWGAVTAIAVSQPIFDPIYIGHFMAIVLYNLNCTWKAEPPFW